MSGRAAGRDWKPKGNPWLIAVVVTLGAFMEVLDTTIVNVSLPHISGSLGVSYDDATWALTSYLLANGVVLTISGWLGAVFGRRRYFLICIAGFTACSFLCGSSTNLVELIAFRLAQGFFGGGLQPNQQSIILDTFEPSQRGKAFGITALATIVAPVLGPTLGGWITDSYSWRWVFFINIPVGVLTFLAVQALVEDPPWARARAVGVDYVGLSLITLGLGALEVMADRGEDDDWFGSNFIRAMAVLAALGISGAIAWLLTARDPVVNIRVLRDRNFAIGSLLVAMMASVLYSAAIIIPQLAQQRLGYTATLAGYILSPGGVVIILLIPVVGQLMKVAPLKYLIALGFFIMGCALLYSATLAPDIDFRTLGLMRAAQTAGLAFMFVPISTVAYATLPREDNADATALFTMFRNFFGSLSISFATAIVAERTQAHLAHLGRHLTPLDLGYALDLGQVRGALAGLGRAPAAIGGQATGYLWRQAQSQAAFLAYGDMFLYVAMASFAVVPFAFLLSAKKGGGGGGAH